MLLAGRLSDGRSFAVVEDRVRPDFLIRSADSERAAALAERARLEASISPAGRRTLSGEPCDRVEARDRGGLRRLEEAFAAGGLAVFEADVRAADRFLAERRIRGVADPRHLHARPLRGRGLPGPGTGGGGGTPVPPHRGPGHRDGRGGGDGPGRVPRGPGNPGGPLPGRGGGSLLPGPGGRRFGGPEPFPFEESDETGRPYRVRPFSREADLLRALAERIQALDPDLITGWNVVDFDLAQLSRRRQALGVPFRIGRTEESADIRELDGGAATRLPYRAARPWTPSSWPGAPAASRT
ncbi:MAG: hypothetical protein M0C28_23630 [Candidatus Moduliflexus flocculans]|nr:hypothetical protein [Candidatus Moduliflexus flocculans]